MMTDDIFKLISQAKAGDRQAFGQLYQLYFTPVYRYVLLRIHHRQVTEDLVQQIFVKAYRAVNRFEPRDITPLAWLFTIARNTVIDHVRQSRPTVNLDDMPHLPSHADQSPAAQVDQVVMMAKVEAALKQLTDDQAEAIRLKYQHELSGPEIAKIMGKRQSAIRQLLTRGLQKLRSTISF